MRSTPEVISDGHLVIATIYLFKQVLCLFIFSVPLSQKILCVVHLFTRRVVYEKLVCRYYNIDVRLKVE